VWGSEFTSKDAALQGGSENAARLNENYAICLVVVVVTDWWHLTAISPNPLHGN
jgi:hypothetical protein